MLLMAHIGNVPVEEWLPFLFPVVALYLYGRHWSRRRREEVRRLPGAAEMLNDATTGLVVSELAEAHHGEVSRAHLPLLYPPGPDGRTAAELAGPPARIRGRSSGCSMSFRSSAISTSRNGRPAAGSERG